MEYAGFWRRFLAVLIDAVFGIIIGIFINILFPSKFAGGIIFSLLYQPFFDSSVLQGTPGKALLDMRIVDLNGQRITLKKALIRFAMRIVSSVLLCIGFLIQPFTEKRQTLHDIAAETLVVNGSIKNVNFFRAWYDQMLEALGMVDKVPAERAKSSSSQPSPADLAGLYDLYQKGILTESEYNEKREELLKRL